jgi:hypothetical protein
MLRKSGSSRHRLRLDLEYRCRCDQAQKNVGKTPRSAKEKDPSQIRKFSIEEGEMQ